MIKLTLLFRALSIITHVQESVGNESIIRKTPVRTPLGWSNVPILSGNCIRNMLRRMWLEDLELTELSKRELNLAASGGNVRTAGGKPSLQLRQQVYQYVPGLALFGGSTKDDIIPGRAQVDFATLVCREYASLHQQMYPELSGVAEWDHVAPAIDWVGKWAATRHDPVPGEDQVVTDDGDGNTSMPYGGECVKVGALFLSQIRIRSSDPVLLGCVLNSLHRWQRSGGVLGGKGAAGHGRLECSILTGLNQEEAMQAYQDHKKNNRSTITSLIQELSA